MVLPYNGASHQNALPFSSKDEQVNLRDIEKPSWLDAFLRKTFFGLCKDHPYRRNELNKYCINCDQSACQYCVSSGPHHQHKVLKVYRHVYKDVVSLGTMEKYINCSEIQPYKCNKRLVISLNPLPHSGSASNNEASCNICSRKLAEPDVYRYCSISCKVRAGSPEPNGSAPPAASDENQSTPVISDEKRSSPLEIPEGSLRRKRRKGIPHRAPFF